MTTAREALRRGSQRLMEVGVEGARLDALVLLREVLQMDQARFYTYPDLELSQEQERRFEHLIERRSKHEPVAYLLGHKEFYGRDFLVDPRVLIPRPETELLVEAALQDLRSRLASKQVPIVADIGTGSGAIPITLALEEPLLPYFYAVDISPEALEIANQNCRLHNVQERVRLLRGDLLQPLSEPVDLLVANLPYVGTSETAEMTPDVLDYEPHLALFSGEQGLDLLKQLLEEMEDPTRVAPEATALLEIGYQQSAPLTQLVWERWPGARLTFIQDYAGWDRLAQLKLPGPLDP